MIKEPNQTARSVTLLDFLTFFAGQEMGSNFHDEAVKAQIVATYTDLILFPKTSPINISCKMDINSLRSTTSGWSWKSDTNYNRLQNLITSVIGQAALYNGQPIDSTYFSMSAGKTLSNQYYWVGGSLPYLQSVDSHWDTSVSGFQTTYSITTTNFKALIKSKYSFDLGGDPSTWFSNNMSYDPNNLYVTNINLIDTSNKPHVLTGRNIREDIIGATNLRSISFSVIYNVLNDTLTFTAKGNGHCVGMSQWGAEGMAKEGSTYQQILTHYYTGITIGNMMPS